MIETESKYKEEIEKKVHELVLDMRIKWEKRIMFLTNIQKWFWITLMFVAIIIGINHLSGIYFSYLTYNNKQMEIYKSRFNQGIETGWNEAILKSCDTLVKSNINPKIIIELFDEHKHLMDK